MIIDISKYKSSPKDKFLFDTNVWICILNPMGNREKDLQRIYSAFYKNVKNNDIFFASHIISEYINRALRYDFNQKRKKRGWDSRDFKRKYRESPDHEKTIKSIKSIIKKPLLERCHKLDDKLNKNTLIKIVDFISDKKGDFNDKLTVELVRGQDIKIVTDDFDFKEFSTDIDILTSNKKFWN